MLHIDEALIRQRATDLAVKGVTVDEAELLRRARADIEREFRSRTREAGRQKHRMNPPLEVEEALTPGLYRQPGGMKWGRASDDEL